MKAYILELVLEDNRALPMVFGEYDRHLTHIEKILNISITHRGNEVMLSGDRNSVEDARDALENLYIKVSCGEDIELTDVDASVRLVQQEKDLLGDVHNAVITTPRKKITARTPNQMQYMKDMQNYPLCFGIGPAGTGKTYLAVCQGISMLNAGVVDKFIITRPVVEAGERLGFLPGDLKEKVAPYLRPIYDVLYECMAGDVVNRKIENNEIEIAPLAYMRGRTLKNAFILLDEAQNTTTVQMKMFLTRLGENSRMVITGDTSQVDLPHSQVSGLTDAFEILDNIDNIATNVFTAKDVVRHPLVVNIVEAYEKADNAKRKDDDKRYKVKQNKIG